MKLLLHRLALLRPVGESFHILRESVDKCVRLNAECKDGYGGDEHWNAIKGWLAKISWEIWEWSQEAADTLPARRPTKSRLADASRLDAELARADMAPIDLTRILVTVVAMANQVADATGIRVTLDIGPRQGDSDARKPRFTVLGHDLRLGQVFNNLIDNAKSFSEPGGSVRVSLRHAKGAAETGFAGDGFEIVIDDDGPGIPADAFERIFERFYTDRPGQGFGQNSGLGLSISRQIIEAHGGRIRAMNRCGPAKDESGPCVYGARFVVWLRAAD